MCGSRGGGGGTDGVNPPLKYHKFIVFPSNTGPNPLKITKLPNQHSTGEHYRPVSETPFQWRFASRLIISRFWWSLEHCSPKKKNIRVGPPLTKLSGSTHVLLLLLSLSMLLYCQYKYAFYQILFYFHRLNEKWVKKSHNEHL